MRRAFWTACALALAVPAAAGGYTPCLLDVPRQEKRSKELQEIVKADQEARKDWEKLSPKQLQRAASSDDARRQRVAQIFGEGCFKTPLDFAAAALVFQHGDTPDHFFQAFIWAKRAVELGDPRHKDLMAIAVDRYLVSTGRKQLFGSQANRPDDRSCFCVSSVEMSFPEERRAEHATLEKTLDQVDDLNKGRGCPRASLCDDRLAPTPAGSITGFW